MIIKDAYWKLIVPERQHIVLMLMEYRKMMEYLVWFNTKRVHKSLGNVSPIDYVIKSNPESQMYAFYTVNKI